MISTNLTAPTSFYPVGFLTKLVTHHWIGSMLFALSTHLVLWYLPVYLPAQQSPQPQPIRLMLQAQPTPIPPKIQPKPPKVRKERQRRKPPVRRVQKRRVVPQPVVKKTQPVPRQTTPRPNPRTIAPFIPHRAVAKLTPKAVLPTPVSPSAPMASKAIAPVDLRPYGRSLYQSILHHKRYPQMAARMGYEGTVILIIRVSSQGQLLGQPRVVRSSGFDILDQEAIRMVQAAAPSWSAMPSGFSQRYKAFRMPIRFSLHG